MPIYEYLCQPCNRVFSFMAKSHAETETKPATCPQCGEREMKRLFSRFAIAGGERKSVAASGDVGAARDEAMDDPRVEREMMKLMDAADNLDENDPRQLGSLMRRMSEISGEGLDPAMEEAIRRLEGGEDPDTIEEEMGDLFGEDDGDAAGAGGVGGGPSYDDGLYSF